LLAVYRRRLPNLERESGGALVGMCLICGGLLAVALASMPHRVPVRLRAGISVQQFTAPRTAWLKGGQRLPVARRARSWSICRTQEKRAAGTGGVRSDPGAPVARR